MRSANRFVSASNASSSAFADFVCNTTGGGGRFVLITATGASGGNVGVEGRGARAAGWGGKDFVGVVRGAPADSAVGSTGIARAVGTSLVWVSQYD